MSVCWSNYESNLGSLLMAADQDALVAIRFASGSRAAGPETDWHDSSNSLLERAIQQLEEYFSGVRRTFEIPLRPTGTGFQRRVWTALQEIPYGTTLSYGALASRLGDLGAVRAVGAANGANPIPILIPCHRVVGSNGSLVGYGGGLDRKRALLELEQHHSGLFAP